MREGSVDYTPMTLISRNFRKPAKTANASVNPSAAAG